MKKLLALLLLFGIVGCASLSPYQNLPDYKATAFLPGNDSFARDITGTYTYFWSWRDAWVCSGKETLDDAMRCAIKNCEKTMSTTRSKNIKFIIEPIPYKCIARNLSEDKTAVASSEIPQMETLKASGLYEEMLTYNTKLLLNAESLSKQSQDEFNKANRKLVDARNIERRDEALLKEAENLKNQFIAFINQKKELCKVYGFKTDDAIATCVQNEVNTEVSRLQSKLALEKLNTNQQSQNRAYAKNRALNSYGRCLLNEGNFAACGNAWNGYTPKPAKKVYRCDYDVFGNQITSTCREK